METQSTSLKKIALNYGVLLALLSIVLQVITYVLDVHIDRPWWLSVAQMAVSVTVMVYGLKAYKQSNSGYLTVIQAIKTGLAISVVAGIITIIFNYFFITFIDPDFIDKTMEFSRQKMIEDNPNLSDQQVTDAMDISAKFMSPWIISAFAMIGTLFFGFIISMVAGLIMKKNPPNEF